VKAIKYAGKGRFKIVEVPVPRIGPCEALVRMRVAGICASDLHIQKRHDARYEDPAAQNLPTPGHEPAGVVERVGGDVTSVKVGDRVAVYHKVGCGACDECRAGRVYLCRNGKALSDHADGACADFLAVDQANCLKLPDGVSFEAGAVLMCAGGTAYSGLAKLGPIAGETVAIFGLGPVGLSALMFAKAMGALVIAVDLKDNRCKLAQQYGADHVINASRDTTVKEVYEAAPGVPVNTSRTVENIYGLTGIGAHAAAECSGRISGRINAVDCVRRRGRIVFLGIDNSFEIDGTFQKGLEADKIIFKELKIYGSNVFPITIYDEMVDFVRTASVPIGEIVTDKFPIEMASEAFQAAESQETGKAAIVWPE